MQKTEPQRRLREATTTINQQIKAAEARKEALYQQDAAMIAASNVSNMCDTRHMHISERKIYFRFKVCLLKDEVKNLVWHLVRLIITTY